jgi:transcription initiation factor TFIIIB Brf1 subunit/transcription initiation factor TFIIB
MFTKYPDLLKKHIDFYKICSELSNNNKVIDFPCGTSIKVNNLACECGKEDIIENFSAGIIVCRNCGQVLEELIDESPEWKNYDDSDQKNVRCGAQINVLLPISSMVTGFGGKGRNRMKIIQTWCSIPYKERSLSNEFKKINNICQKLDIPKCIEDDTQIMYKQVTECRHDMGDNKGKIVITRGKNRTGIMAACLYFACAKKGTMYTPKEIGEKFGIDQSEMNRGIKNLRKMIDVKKIACTDFEMPNQFIRRYCNSMKMLNIHADEAVRISTNVEKINIVTEHNPYSVAAACILLTAKKFNIKHVTVSKLASKFGISDVTIQKTFKKLESHSDVIFDDKKTEEVFTQKENKIEEDTSDIPDEIKEKMIQFGVIPDKKESKSNIEEIDIKKQYEEFKRLAKVYNKIRETRKTLLEI